MRFSELPLEDLFAPEEKPSFTIKRNEGGAVVILHRAGKPIDRIECLSPGHANQARLRFSDLGMAGKVEGGPL